MNTAKTHAAYLFEHYKQSGPNFADMLFQRICKTDNLTLAETVALKNEFRKLLKTHAAAQRTEAA